MTSSPAQIRAAYDHCERAARGHYENFPVASLLVPRGIRRHVAAIYAFAREADDFADEAEHEGHRLELLDDWRLMLDRAARGSADHPVFVAIAHTIETRGIPVQPLRDLLEAFRRDVTVASYGTFDELLDYCRLSANPVGRLLLHLFGRAKDPLIEMSDAICTALQLANFWQDVSIDLDKGRCYLPEEDLRRFGCSDRDLRSRRPTPAFSDLMRFQVERTRSLFERGAGLPAAVGGRLGFELKLVLHGGLRILERIDSVEGDVFGRRPVLTVPDWGRMIVRAALT